MSTEEIIIISKNFYYSYTYLAWAIVAGLLLFVYFKPKATLKMIGGLLVFVFLIYSFSLLGKSSSTGMNSKKDMINQTRDKME
jgi:hypothetical protein